MAKLILAKTSKKCYNYHMKGWRENFARDDTRANKIRFDKKVLKRLREIKTWQLVIILLIFVLLTAIFLRLNNLNMIDKRAALVAADKTGNIAKIDTAAKDLRNYVWRHMNTYTGRVALQTLYDQAAQKAIEASRPPEIDGSKYQQATNDCMPQLHGYGYRAWANCVANAVGISDITTLDTNVTPPDPNAYYVEFAPVRWSFDPAGISLLVCFILAIIIVLRLIFLIILRITLRLKYRAA